MGHLSKMVMDDPSTLIVPAILLLVTLLVGLAVRRWLIGALQRQAERAGSQLGILLSETLRGAILFWFAILGLHIATQSSEIPLRYLRYISPTLAVLWIVSLTIATSRLAGNAVRFYGSHVAGDVRPVTSLTQKLAQLVVLIFGLVWMLKVVFNINLTPILATLGVGGLAVALALQDTLSNLFAGFYVSISGLLRIGDYIKLNTGEEGYVSDITWRCTTMRGQSNNLVVIPNNKLGQAIYTNYFLPERRVGHSIPVAVSIHADIERVQQVLLEETLAATGDIAGLLSSPEPYVLFTSGPSDYGLVFQVNFSVNEFAIQYQVQSELRKRLWRRLRSEGIPMALPASGALIESGKHRDE